jgi:tRNA(Ile)-lysidine synthase
MGLIALAIQELNLIPPCNSILVAVSGGVDSMVLLDEIAKSKLDKSIKIIHINHNLQVVSAKWQDLITQRCRELNLELIVESIKLDPASAQCLEEQARDLRYLKFSQHLKPNDLLLLGHHKNDQVETILFRLVKGTGLKGLAGIKKYSKYKHFFKFCPFLDLSKAEIIQYALANNIKWYDDPSNQQNNFDRNYLRNKILPELQTRWPTVVDAISRAGNVCLAAMDELLPIIQANYSNCHDSEANTLSISKVKTLSNFMQKEVIRYWLESSDYQSCSLKHLEILLEQVIMAGADRNPILKCGKFVFRRYRDKLFLFAAKAGIFSHAAVDCIPVPVEPLPDANSLLKNNLNILRSLNSLCSNKTSLICSSYFLTDSNKCIVKYEQKGDKAKKIFQKYNIPPWERGKYPAVFMDDKLVAIVGLWRWGVRA